MAQSEVTLTSNAATSTTITPSTVGFSSVGLSSGRITVDVISSEIHKTKSLQSKYVIYKLHVYRGTDTKNEIFFPTIERRYSDFMKLHDRLTNKHPVILRTVVFPEKLFSGNFRQDTIGRRSQSFEQYLSHLCDTAIVTSPFFTQFFYWPEFKAGCHAIRLNQFSEALPYFQKALHMQSIFLPPHSTVIVLTLCALSVCFTAIDEFPAAFDHTKKAINIISNEDLSLLLPLLIKAIRLAITLNKPKEEFEQRIADIHEIQPILLTNPPTLLESLFNRLEKFKQV